jgi:hypothetical protein
MKYEAFHIFLERISPAPAGQRDKLKWTVLFIFFVAPTLYLFINIIGYRHILTKSSPL